MTKAPLAFRTISEVSETLDIPQHVLRFWEGKFSQIKPLKRAGGRRYYRPEDIELLRGVRALLYAEGYTIKGVQKLLKTSGAKYVSDVGRFGVKRAGRAGGDWDGGAADLVHRVTDVDEHSETLEFTETEEETSGASDEVEIRDVGIVGGPSVALTERRAKLEAALQELLALRDMLRTARPSKADAA